ncbi:MAG: regulatory protein RecX [Microgenomates group bacterium]
MMEKALAFAYRYLSFRPRSIQEVERYLEQKAKKYLFTPGEIQATIEILKDQGFLNDVEFIKSFVNARNSLKPKGKRMLILELKKSGVSSEDIDQFFSNSEAADENALAIEALRHKMKALAMITDEKVKFTKAVSFLQRRGFSFEIARQAYLQLTQK